MRLLVYTPLITPRIKYIFNFIFKDILRADLDISQNLSEFISAGGPKLCYGQQPVGQSLFFKSSGLLTDQKIAVQRIGITSFGDQKVPFPVAGGRLPFDIFAASFYFLTRYEEYLPFDDRKGPNYHAQLSLQHKLGLLRVPVIDEWALILKNILLKNFPSMSFGRKDFSFRPAYSPELKSRATGSGLRKALHFMNSLVRKKLQRKHYAQQINGIHSLMMEMNKNGVSSRPEFLRTDLADIPVSEKSSNWEEKLKIPKSYLRLTIKNINQDYSMYYPDTPGFRAGTCSPFYWYDLQIEKQSQLKIYPIALTDKGLRSGKPNKDLLLQLNELMDHVKLVNGSFYSLWQDKTIALA
jgi:hypothetical protein